MDAGNERNDQANNVFVVSASRLLAEHVSRAAQEKFFQVRTFSTLDSFLSVYDSHMPGCVLLAVDRYDRDQSALLRRITSINTQAQVVLVVNSIDWRIHDVVEAIHAGFVDFLDTSSLSDRLVPALQLALERDHLKRALAQVLLPHALAKRLSSEETRIFNLLIQGRTTKQVGAELGLSVRTVHYRKKAVFERLGVRNRTEAFELIRRSRLQGAAHGAGPHLFSNRLRLQGSPAVNTQLQVANSDCV